MSRRVVITGFAAITPIGNTREDIVRHLTDGRSGVKPLRSDGLLTEHIHSGVFGTVDYPIEYDFSRQCRKTMGPVAYYACQVAKEVLEQSGLTQGIYHLRQAGCGLRFHPRQPHGPAGDLPHFLRRKQIKLASRHRRR